MTSQARSLWYNVLIAFFAGLLVALLLLLREQRGHSSQFAMAAESVRRLQEAEAKLELGKTTKAAAKPTPASSSGQTPASDGFRPRSVDFKSIEKAQQLHSSSQYKSLRTTQQLGEIDVRYAALFKSLGLDSETQAALREYLLDKANLAQEVTDSVQGEVAAGHLTFGKESHFAWNEVMASETAQLDGDIKSRIGEDSFAKYARYEEHLTSNLLAGAIQQEMFQSGITISSEQQGRLLGLLLEEKETGPRGPATIAVPSGNQGMKLSGVSVAMIGPDGYYIDQAGSIYSNHTIADEVIQTASSFLTTEQVAVLKKIQARQANASALARSSHPGR